MTFIESHSLLLLFVHHVVAVCAAAVSVHVLLRSAKAFRDRPGYLAQTELHTRLLALLYAATFVLGALLYPRFRVHVRYEYFDRVLPWATHLFEIKEHAAALGLIPALGLFALTHAMKGESAAENRRFAPLYYGLLVCVLVVIAYCAWCGWYLGKLRSV